MNLNMNPYYDDFDPSKHYTQILAVPGRAEQAREFTQAQSILLYIIKQLSSALLKEGSIVQGMDFTFGGTNNQTLTVNPGKVYLNGIVHDFPGGTLQMTLQGVETVGVKVIETIVTEVDDPSLKDPAQGFANYGRPGAHRLKQDVVLTYNDPTSPTIYTFVDGKVQTIGERPELQVISDVLAAQTYQQSGNFVVSGFTLSTSDHDPNNILLTADAGIAYVRGYQVNRPSPALVTVPKAQTTREVDNEPKTFQNGTLQYKLNNYPVKDILNVEATVQVTQTITRGSLPNGQDLLPHQPVVSIISVTQGATTYVAGVDYQQTGNAVDWSLGGAEPATGSTYTVTYTYNTNLVQGTDFKLTNIPDANGNLWGYVDFTGMSGLTPVNGTTMLVNYEFYLARADRVYLDSQGNVSVLPGQPDILSLVQPPTDSDPLRLSLGTITLYPNSAVAVVDMSGVIKKVSMADLNNMLQRLNNLEYNTALSDLDNQALQGQNPTQLKGIFTDGFQGISKADVTHPLWNASIDILNFQLLLPSTQTIIKPTISTGNSSNVVNWANGKMYTLSYTDTVILSQPIGTSTLNVNPYNSFQGSPSVTVTPSQDNWIDTTTVTYNQVVSVSYQTIFNWWGWEGYAYTSYQNVGVARTVIDSIQPYARQITLTLNGTGFPANSDLISATIDGVSVSLTPLGTTTAGSQPGTVKSDANGNVSCSFVIPQGIRTGARKIVLSNPVASASCVFTSNGILETVQQTVYEREIIYRYFDPLAESFTLYQDQIITGLDLYFATKDNTIPVTIQIRDMQNGLPGTTVLGSVTLQPSQVNVSTDGHVATHVAFPTPIFLNANTQYAIVVMTTSTNYSMFIAQLGQKDLLSNNFMTANPYQDGVLFTSSNGATWTPTQNADLKFALYGARFNSTGTLQFQPTGSLNIDALVLQVAQETPQGTTVQWQYQSSVGGPWLPLTPSVTTNLSSVANMVAIRAVLSTSNPAVSPAISGQNLTLVGLTTQTSGTYVSRQITTSQPYSTVTQIINANIPSGASVTVKFSTDGTTWITQGSPTSVTPLGNGVSQYTYTTTLPGNQTATNFRARIDLSSTSQTVKPVVSSLMNILK